MLVTVASAFFVASLGLEPRQTEPELWCYHYTMRQLEGEYRLEPIDP